MAERAAGKRDWTDRESIRERAKASALNFLSPVKNEAEPERPLSPELVARVSEPSGKEGLDVAGEFHVGEENHEERLTRATERRRINDSPQTIYPG